RKNSYQFATFVYQTTTPAGKLRFSPDVDESQPIDALSRLFAADPHAHARVFSTEGIVGLNVGGPTEPDDFANCFTSSILLMLRGSNFMKLLTSRAKSNVRSARSNGCFRSSSPRSNDVDTGMAPRSITRRLLFGIWLLEFGVFD